MCDRMTVATELDINQYAGLFLNEMRWETIIQTVKTLCEVAVGKL